jgi:hypothetical protein
MEGGTVSGNMAIASGGVFVDYECVFTMTGGTIGGNTAHYGGGVFVNYEGVFTMASGTVSGNMAAARKNYGYDASGGMGGGVCVVGGGVFTMEGGTIGGNAADINGGGVCVREYGVFVKSGGTIDAANKAPYGRAVYVQDGRNHYRVRDAAAEPEVRLDSRESGWERGESAP